MRSMARKRPMMMTKVNATGLRHQTYSFSHRVYIGFSMAELCDWFTCRYQSERAFYQLFQPIRRNTNRDLAHVTFPALAAGCTFFRRVPIGSLPCEFCLASDLICYGLKLRFTAVIRNRAIVKN